MKNTGVPVIDPGRKILHTITNFFHQNYGLVTAFAQSPGQKTFAGTLSEDSIPTFMNQTIDVLARDGTNAIKHRYRRHVRGIVIKAQQTSFNATALEQIAIREDAVHRDLSDGKHTLFGSVVSGKDIVPAFLLGVTLNLGGGVHFRFSFMEAVDGDHLCNVMSRMTPALYARAERCVLYLWASGYAHTNLHCGNITVRGLKDLILGDFGSCVRLPQQSVVEPFRRKIKQTKYLQASGSDIRRLLASSGKGKPSSDLLFLESFETYLLKNGQGRIDLAQERAGLYG